MKACTRCSKRQRAPGVRYCYDCLGYVRQSMRDAGHTEARPMEHTYGERITDGNELLDLNGDVLSDDELAEVGVPGHGNPERGDNWRERKRLRLLCVVAGCC